MHNKTTRKETPTRKVQRT